MKKIGIAIAVTLIIIQFIRPDRNIASAKNANHISNKYSTPENVALVLDKACYDCHSNTTRYPWYATIQPVAWWLDHHIKEGKGEINFDEFLTYSPKKAKHKLEEVNEMVKEKEMPLESYTWMHKEANLTDAERLIIAEWAIETMNAIDLNKKQ